MEARNKNPTVTFPCSLESLLRLSLSLYISVRKSHRIVQWKYYLKPGVRILHGTALESFVDMSGSADMTSLRIVSSYSICDFI